MGSLLTTDWHPASLNASVSLLEPVYMSIMYLEFKNTHTSMLSVEKGTDLYTQKSDHVVHKNKCVIEPRSTEHFSTVWFEHFLPLTK